MSTKNNCSKCGGAMIKDFPLDRGDNYSKNQQVWVAGQPETSFWSGGLKTSDREMHHVQTFRCADCGCLEFLYDRKDLYLRIL